MLGKQNELLAKLRQGRSRLPDASGRTLNKPPTRSRINMTGELAKTLGLGNGLTVRELGSSQKKTTNVLPQPQQPNITRRELLDINREVRMAYNDLDDLQHTGVTISILSTSEMKKLSACDVTLIQNDGNRQTVNDPRMGATKSGVLCSVCQVDECAGHHGYIPFATPIPDPQYLKNKVILSILTCVCPYCGNLYLSEEVIRSKGILQYSGERRLKMLATESVGQHCSNKKILADGRQIKCSKPYKYESKASKDMGMVVYTIDGTPKEKTTKCTMSGDEIKKIFNLISDRDAQLMGFRDSSVPIRFVRDGMLVPPIVARQPKIINNVARIGDMTALLNKIVSSNAILRDTIERKGINDGKSIIDATKDLYKRVSEYHEHITGLIQGKEALMRGNSMGKRGDFCGRTVIGPDDSIRPDQVTIPLRMAMKLTPEVLITAENKAEIENLHKQGRITQITIGHGRSIGQTKRIIPGVEYAFRIGDKVNRWLQDGDFVTFGRQPTLHKQSLMGHRAVIKDNRLSIGINLAVTGAYNADFDGDEGNINLPIDIFSVEDVAERMYVGENIISSQSSVPIVAPVYDTITGIYHMTNPKTKITPAMLIDCHMMLENKEGLATLPKRLASLNVDRLSGQALFSCTLPPDFDHRWKGMTIVKGVLIEGHLTKSHVGGTARSIVQELVKDYSSERSLQWMTDIIKVTRRYLDTYGFTVGYGDCNYGETPEAIKLVNNTIQKAEAQMQLLGTPPTDPLELKEYENQVEAIYSQTKSIGLDLAKSSMAEDNTIKAMSKQTGCGSKGAPFNTAQIGALLGQQTYAQERMRRTLGNDRTLPYYRPGDYSLRSGGFCHSGFFSGLHPDEFFNHCTGGREGLADTATKVAGIGEMHRRIAKAVENITIYPDGSVRNAVGVIFQTLYGEDGLNGAKMLLTPRVGGDDFLSFIDLKQTSRKINADYGWYKLPEEYNLQQVDDSTLDMSTAGMTDISNPLSTASNLGTTRT